MVRKREVRCGKCGYRKCIRMSVMKNFASFTIYMCRTERKRKSEKKLNKYSNRNNKPFSYGRTLHDKKK